MQSEIYYDENRNVIDKPVEQNQVVDSNGVVLVSGDSIISIQSLPVKNATNINKGEKFTNIRLTDDREVVTAKHPKNGTMYLRTEFFRKA